MGLLETVKDVATLVQKADNIELLKQILSLQTEALEIFEENRTLREQVKRLEGEMEFARTLTFEAPFYFAPNDRIPYCAKCWEADHRGIHLLATSGGWENRRWECFKCASVYLLDDPLLRG